MKLLIKMPLMVLLAVFMLSSCTTDSIDDKADAMELSLVTPEEKAIETEILELINSDINISK